MVNISSSSKYPTPVRRPLRVFAFDPSRGRLLGNEMQIEVRFRPLAPGPIDTSGAHDQIALVVYGISRKEYYHPVNLSDPFFLLSHGIAPSRSFPRFPPRMVYA